MIPQPTNNIFLGGDPLLNTSSLDAQISALKDLAQRYEAARQQIPQSTLQAPPQQQVKQRLLWDEIDSEISPMTDEQKSGLFNDEDYATNYNILQSMVQTELLNLVKGRIEQSQEGHELLSSQLRIVRKLKSKIVDDTNKEMELFRKFREFSKSHPEVTYEEFIKSQLG